MKVDKDYLLDLIVKIDAVNKRLSSSMLEKFRNDFEIRTGKKLSRPKTVCPPRPFPATTHDIELLQKNFEVTLPPSYVAFMELQDGWPSFFGEASFFGANEMNGNGLNYRDVTSSFRGIEPALSADAIVIGGGGRTVYYFKRSSRHDDSELDLVDFAYDREPGCYPNFLAFLENTWRMLSNF
jgi:hypothetical protein